MTSTTLASSFRDPSGFVFTEGDKLYRQVNFSYKDNYDMLMSSGLYNTLVKQNLLIPHEEASIKNENAYKIIKPEIISFISYPYEWCLSQLKDAALLTLKIQKIALTHEMSLKDASSYNVQFKNSKPVFIDTLSFEKYIEGKPWIAYKQFCQHFLGPLSLMSLKDIRLNQLLKTNIDGIPLDLVSSLLPFSTRLKPSLLLHLHLHAKSQKHYSNKTINKNNAFISKNSLLGLVDSLETTINGLHWNPHGTVWADYYENTNYTSDSFKHKQELVASFLDKNKTKSLLDLGANEGVFSRLASDKNISTISCDMDPGSIEKSYLTSKKNNLNILPLLLDLTNPSSDIGFNNEERSSIWKRISCDTVMALALIHHLAISNNLPLDTIAKFFSSICKSLIIEFVPKNDSQVQKLLANREDIFINYTQKDFEKTFNQYFLIIDSAQIKESQRTLYNMQKK